MYRLRAVTARSPARVLYMVGFVQAVVAGVSYSRGTGTSDRVERVPYGVVTPQRKCVATAYLVSTRPRSVWSYLDYLSHYQLIFTQFDEV